MTPILSVEKEMWRTQKGWRGNETDFVRLARAGFYSVELSFDQHVNWPDVHKWCWEQFGREHYTWTGSTFWFETERDALLFTLKWS